MDGDDEAAHLRGSRYSTSVDGKPIQDVDAIAVKRR
jgi:hypothetical protein